MIRLEVRKIGDALGVALPQEAIHALDAVEDATLELTAEPGGGYLLSRVNADIERKMQLVEGIAERYRDTPQDLAE
ncbi:MAG: AbrB family transcriptional regulator [Trueperaceae bacterium]